MLKLVSWLIYSIGFILSRLPDRALEGLAWVLGRAIYYLFWKRCRLLLVSLAYSFPHYSEKRRKQLAKESCKRTVEMALVSLLLPFWSKENLKQRFDFDPALKLLRPFIEAGRPLLILTPHFSLMEAITLAPLFYEGKLPPMGVVYRPLNNTFLESFIKKTRERGGMRLLSRKAGLLEAIKLLQNKGIVAVLFDQNAGIHGLETLFFERPVYATELPQLLLNKSQAQAVFLYMRRRGFAQGSLEGSVLDSLDAAELIAQDSSKLCIIQANRCLEDLLKQEDELCADWLWLHKRWDMKRKWNERLCARVKKTLLPETLFFKGLEELPRKRKVWIRLPNWLGDVVMIVPLLTALRKALPDAAFSVVGKAQFECLFIQTDLKRLSIADHFIPLPPRGKAYWPYFWNLRKQRPELYLLFTNSFRGDLEAFLTRAPERFGIKKPGKCRPCLTHVWPQPSALDEATLHQTQLWYQYLQYFGLEEALDLKPLALRDENLQSLSPSSPAIALICGTENSPEKRWPLGHWKALIALVQKHYPEHTIKLLGTAKDAAITHSLAQDDPRIEDLAGKTSLAELMHVLKQCKLVVGNDTGGLHLANMLGVPIIALYGPTNPVRTGPIYEAKRICIQAEGLGHSKTMAAISPQRVFEAVQDILGAV